MLLLTPGTDSNLGQGFGYASLAVGSLLALFLYPHSLTGLLSSASSMAIRRNAILLPIYSLALALLALLGYTAVSAGVKGMPEYAAGFASFGNNFAIPALFLHMFPSWFAGVAFAAIAIGALVPASIMAIASGNLFTRNIYKEFIAPDCTSAQEARAAKLASLMLKLGALFFVLLFQTSYAIQLQLLGGIWIIQTFPTMVFGAYTRWFNDWALLIGWAVGTYAGTAMAISANLKPTYPLKLGGYSFPGYTAFYTLLLNLAVAVVLTLVFNALRARRVDATVATDYHA
jgi:SSS family solute:Na+ symporter